MTLLLPATWAAHAYAIELRVAYTRDVGYLRVSQAKSRQSPGWHALTTLPHANTLTFIDLPRPRRSSLQLHAHVQPCMR
jgi:hypothetical protein